MNAQAEAAPIDWTTIAGGRCQGQPWRVGVAGYDLATRQAFALDDTDWKTLVGCLPLAALNHYASGNGLQFQRITGTSAVGVDGVFLIDHERGGQPPVECDDGASRYLLLREAGAHEALPDPQAFARIFVPNDEPFNDERLVFMCSTVSIHGWYPPPQAAGQVADGPDYGQTFFSSADCWIGSVTAAIASDAARVRGDAPLLSVIIPTYNYGRYLGQSVQSVLDQGISNLEILVLDNASTDDTAQVMARFSGHPQVRYMRNRYNAGAGHNWRNGLWIARGHYFTFLSADDYFNPGHLQRLLPILERNPRVAVGYTSIRWVDAESREMIQPRHPGYRGGDYVGGRNETAELLIHDCYTTPSAVIYRREAFRRTWRLGRVSGAGDWEMAVQMAERYPDFAYVNSPGVSYRWHGTQDSNRFYASTAPLKDHLTIVEGVFERGSQDRLRGREHEVADHVERRLALYPHEHGTTLGAQAMALVRRLHALAKEHAAPLFTVIVTTFNRPALLKDALDSIQAQTLDDFEVILVNDCGTPVEHLLGDRPFPLTYLRQGRNQGPAAARNAAHRLARGQYLVYLDDDDLFLPVHLRTLADALQSHPGQVVYSDALFVTEKVDANGRHALAQEQRYRHGRYSHERLAVDNYIPVNTFAWPRALLDETGGFDEHLPALEDWDFLLRLANRVPFHHVPDETVQVRMRADGGERRSQKTLPDYPALYQRIYTRHPDLGDEHVRTGRIRRLQSLGVNRAGAPGDALENWRAMRLPSPAQLELAGRQLAAAGPEPRLGILIRDTRADALQPLLRTLRSLGSDGLPWPTLQVVVLASEGSDRVRAAALDTWPDPATLQVRDWTVEDPAGALNGAVQACVADWLLLVDAGTTFTAGGLLRLRMELAANPRLRAIYADEWYRDSQGTLAPVMRPDLNLDLLLGNPAMMAAHWVFHRQALLEAGGFATKTAGAAELDLILRLLRQGGPDDIGHLPEPLLTCAPPRFDTAAQQNAILAHLHARGYADAKVDNLGKGLHRIDYGHVRQPTVSIVLVASGALATLERCVVSVLEQTACTGYELLLVDNGAPPEVGQWIDQVEALAEGRVRAFRLDPPVSPTAARNLGASQAQGEFLLFLDEGSAALHPQWLQAMLNHGLRPEVAVVGARTVDADGLVTHAGLVPGLRECGGRIFAGKPMDADGYMNRLQVAANCLAVSGGCLLVSRERFLALEGFDAAAFPADGADVDLCLRAGNSGGLVVWTPEALLLHGTAPQALPEAAFEALCGRWLPQLARDPAYNTNLRLDVAGGFELDQGDLGWDPFPARPVPRVLAMPSDSHGSGHYRVLQPFAALVRAGRIDGASCLRPLDVVEVERFAPQVMVIQRRVGDADLARLARLGRHSRAFKVFELDDWLPELPVRNIHRRHMPHDVERRLREGLAHADRFVVSTPALAEACAGWHRDIRVARNRLDPQHWLELSPAETHRDKPRVGWAGGLSHDGDLEMIADVVRELAGEVDWVFFGMCPERLRPYVKEFHPGVDFHAYPRALALLGLDLALAPLEDNAFNRCKSHLRLLEYGACGYPVVCSDLEPYRGDLPVTRVRNRYKDWVGAIRQHLAEREATAAAGQALREAVRRDWMLQGPALEEWRSAWLPD